MVKARCAIGILPAAEAGPERLIASVEKARAFGCGDLVEIALLPAARENDARQALAEAASAANSGGFDWLLAVSARETVSPDIFVKTAPALRVHDGVWGAAGIATPNNPDPKVERATRLAAQDLPAFFHAALAWWIGPSHFVRPAAALRALLGADAAGWYADYMLHLWKEGRAYKTAQRLTLFQDVLPPVAEIVRERLVEHLRRDPVFTTVNYDGVAVRLPYTGLNPVIEREQMRGLFFEAEELRFLAEQLQRGLRIVDVGANTGNHTLFFAAIMQADKVIPIEPEPRSVEAIRAGVAANALANVDLTRLGVAVGAGEGRLRPSPSLTAGLGAMRFVPDANGGVPQLPLDSLIDGRVDLLKIDVEGMEMAVLEGAAGLISRNRPRLYIEVVDEVVAQFMHWVDRNAYRVEKLFPDKMHCNYFLTDKNS
jgi:FkbM family methyltransferase